MLACGVVTNCIDENVLDDRIEWTSDRIVQLFDHELQRDVLALRQWVTPLLQMLEPDDQRHQQSGRTPRLPSTDAGGWTKLNQLEQEFYCDDSDRQLTYDPSRTHPSNVLLLRDDGRPLACAGGASLTRTPELDLEFRGYFQRPIEGALWRPKPVDPRQPVPCRVRLPQDRESLVPCIVDGLPGPWKRWAPVGNVSPFSTDIREVPYYLERIDSIVRGDVQTILAINTKKLRRPVAISNIRLNSLDRAVPPPHVAFAVIDRETGNTLFHSDDELAMATNFADDVGGDPALWALLDSGTRDTVSLVYAGIPIRAHVRPLREGMPWALIVYRGHELEDRLTAVTTALSIFFALFWLVIVSILAVLTLLLIHWRKPGELQSLPAVLGRLMATGARSRWAAGAFLGLPLVLLLYSSWLPWNPWPGLNTGILWRAWSPGAIWDGAWRVPFLAVWSVIAAVSFILHCVLGTHESTEANRNRTSTAERVLVLVAAIVCLVVVPTGLWYGHHRTTLGVGLNRYLLDATLESVHRAREEHRLDMLREFGGGIAPAGDRMRAHSQERRKPDGRWMYEALRPLVGSSKLTNDLMIYSTLRAPRENAYDELRVPFRHQIRGPFPEHLWPLSFVRLVLLLTVMLLVGFIAYSICWICTDTRSRLHGWVEVSDVNSLLESVKKGKRPIGQPLRAIVLYRSARDREDFVDQTKRPVDEKSKSSCRHYDLDTVLDAGFEGRMQFDELERSVGDKSPILIWSGVVPDYKYLNRSEPADRWFASGHEDAADRSRRWNKLVREFRFYVLPGTIPDERLYFDEVWVQSTMEERLQLYALARGGVVDARRTAALSSLVNRGIVEVDKGTGVVRLRSEAFGEFIKHDIDHGELDEWRKQGGGGAWRILWPPLAIGAVLGLAFLAMANPEMRATLLAALLGLLPTVLPFLRGGQSAGSTATPGPAS